MGTAGRSLVFDIAFSETWETSRLSPGFPPGFPPGFARAALIRGAAGDFYGTTSGGGLGYGVVFKLTR